MRAFAARMAWRETRGAPRRLAIVFACVALGVGALVGVGSLAAGLDRTLGREARALLGGDLELGAARPFADRVRAQLAALAAQGATVTYVAELVGMARDPARGATTLIELKAVEPAYPLYGRLATRPPRRAGTPLGPDRALVHPTLLDRLGLGVGDDLWIGQGRFTIAGVIEQEPDRPARLFTLGPRVLIGAEGLARTALVQHGSRVRYRALARLPGGADAATARAVLVRELSDPLVRVTTFDEAQPGLRRFFDQLTTYLGLVGLVSLLVGAIGVAASVRSFVRERQFQIAVLKTLGATARVLLLTYLGQLLALGLLASLLGVVLGLGVQGLLVPLLADFVPFEVDTGLGLGPALRGLAMGVGVTLLAVLWPLLQLRAVPPALILRFPAEPARPRARRSPWVPGAVAAGLAGLALWQAGSLQVGAIFVGAVCAALLLLAALARGVAVVSARLRRLPAPTWRHGVANLRRPGGQAGGVIVALGIGVMLIVAVGLLEQSLRRHVDLERRREAPSFFFVDIQPDQADAFVRTLAAADGGAAAPVLTPVVRGRLAAINGRPVTRDTVEGREDAWRFTREYVLTQAAALPPTNVVVQGRWWTPGEAAARPRVSVEAHAAEHLGVGVGGTLTFDIQGVEVEGEVTSLRDVDWQSLSANFFVIFSPGALDGAPTTYIATARVPRAAERAVQDAVTTAFPNVTAIPLRDVLERLASVLGQIGVAIRLVAVFVIGAGLIVMASALAASRYERLYESLLLRTLGATRGAVARIFAVEYACLGAVAGLGGTTLGALLAWIVLRWVLDVPWAADPLALLLGLALPIALAVAAGGLATFRLLGAPPLPLLRGE